MFRELAEVAERFRDEGSLAPDAYQPRTLNWIVEIGDDGQAHLAGPYRRGELKSALAPMRGDRTGKIGPKNLKPYLL